MSLCFDSTICIVDCISEFDWEIHLSIETWHTGLSGIIEKVQFSGKNKQLYEALTQAVTFSSDASHGAVTERPFTGL